MPGVLLSAWSTVAYTDIVIEWKEVQPQIIAAISNTIIRRIGIFGSFVRGDENPESNVDVFVEFQSGKKTFDNYMGLKNFLESIFERKAGSVTCEEIPTIMKTTMKSASRMPIVIRSLVFSFSVLLHCVHKLFSCILNLYKLIDSYTNLRPA